MGRKEGRVIKEHVQRTHGQSQRGVGSRVGGEDGWGGVGVVEGNGNNCTWTTIKTKKKKRKELKV